MKKIRKSRIFTYICTLALMVACVAYAPSVYAEDTTPTPTVEATAETVTTETPGAPVETTTASSPEVSEEEPTETPIELSEAASAFITLVDAIDQTNAEEVANTYASLLAQSLSEEQPEDLEEQFATAETAFDGVALQIQQAQDAYDSLSDEDKNATEVVAAFASLSNLATSIQAIVDAAYNETPAGAPAPMVTGIHFTQLEIYEKNDDGSTGPLVADLMTNTNVTLENGKTYYFIGSAKKDRSSDDTWMSMSFPWYIQPKTMPGDSNWKTNGAPVSDGITFDLVEDYTAVTGTVASAAAPTDAGTVRYHIMNGTGGSGAVTDAAFQLSFEVVPNYFDGNGSGQNWTTNKFTFAVGDEGSLTPVDTISTGTTTITGVQTAAGEITKSPNVNLGVAAASTNSFAVKNDGVPMVWTNIECDLVYKTADNPTITALTYGGITLTRGTTTVDAVTGNTTEHYTSGLVPAGTIASGFSCTASFPTVEEVKHINIKNIMVTPYQDENPNRVVTGSAELRWNISNAPAVVGLSGLSMKRYDWYGQEDIKANTIIGEANITNVNGSSSVNSYTVEIKTPSTTDAVVREVVVPYWEGHGDTVVINGTTYNIADVANIERLNANYEPVATITTDKLGWDEDQSIETVKWEMGRVPAHYKSFGHIDSSDWASDRTIENHLSVYGSILNGTNVTTQFDIYETVNPTGATHLTANGIGIPSDQKKLGYASNANIVSIAGTGTRIPNAGSTMAGNALDIYVSGYADPWVAPDYYGKYSATDYNPAFYIIVPVGMGLDESSVSINGDSVTPVDVTSSADNVPDGVKIYQFRYPTEDVIGSYKPDSSVTSADIRFRLNTAPSGTLKTYHLEDILQVGTSPEAIAAGFTGTYGGHGFGFGSVTMDNTYHLNSDDDTKKLVGFPTQFDLTPTAGIIVKNSLTGTSNTNPLGTELVFDSTDPINTRLEVDNNYAATYKVEVTNKIGTPADNLTVFIPIPKENQNFGSAFNPNGAQQFDVTLTDKTIPTGWTTTYVKMNPGFTSIKNTRITGTPYTTVSDPADADMVILKADTSFADAATVTFEFNVASGDLSAKDGAINTWYCMTQYDVGAPGAATLYATSLFQEQMIVHATPVPPVPPVTPTPTPKPDKFLVTYLDCYGNTVKIEWVDYNGSSSAPNGNFDSAVNVTSHVTIRQNNCGVGTGYKVPNTADKG